MLRAFSLLTVKSVDDEKRIISGVASSPTPDLMGDVVVPTGGRWKTPIPLLLFHDSKLPVGEVVELKASKSEIKFKATIPHVAEPGKVRDRVDEAWHSIKYGLIATVSIGFKAWEDGVEFLESGGLKFNDWLLLELSLVTVPAQPDALIESFKSMDVSRIHSLLGTSHNDADRAALVNAHNAHLRAATGHKQVRVVRLDQHHRPGASGTKTVTAVPRSLMNPKH